MLRSKKVSPAIVALAALIMAGNVLAPSLSEGADEQYRLALSLAERGELEAAVRAFDTSLDLNCDNARVWCELGQTLQRQGNYREALLALEWGHNLGSNEDGWDLPSARWVEEILRLSGQVAN